MFKIDVDQTLSCLHDALYCGGRPWHVGPAHGLSACRMIEADILEPPDLTTSRRVGAKFAVAPDLTISRKVGERFPKLYDGAMVVMSRGRETK